VRNARPSSCPVLVGVASLSSTLPGEEAVPFDRVLLGPIEGDRLAAELRGLVRGVAWA
jgi:hypothetical protein